MKYKALKRCPNCDGGMFLVTVVRKSQHCRDTVGNIFGGRNDKELEFDQVLMQLIECERCRTLIGKDIYDEDLYEYVEIPNNWDRKTHCEHKYDPEMCSRCAGE